MNESIVVITVDHSILTAMSGDPKSRACYSPRTNTIYIRPSLGTFERRFVLWHEFTHYRIRMAVKFGEIKPESERHWHNTLDVTWGWLTPIYALYFIVRHGKVK